MEIVRNFYKQMSNRIFWMSVCMMQPVLSQEANGIEKGISGIAKIIHDHVGYGLPVAGTVIGVGMMAFGMMKYQYTVAGTGAAITVIPTAFYKIASEGFGAMLP